MGKFIILSIVLMSAAIPMRLSSKPMGRRALRRAQWTMALFIVVWATASILFYPELVPLK